MQQPNVAISSQRPNSHLSALSIAKNFVRVSYRFKYMDGSVSPRYNQDFNDLNIALDFITNELHQPLQDEPRN